jgi:hypothetical protein
MKTNMKTTMKTTTMVTQDKLNAQIVGVRQQEAGKNFVVYADGTTREVESWKEALKFLKRGEIERNLLGVKI